MRSGNFVESDFLYNQYISCVRMPHKVSEELLRQEKRTAGQIPNIGSD